MGECRIEWCARAVYRNELCRRHDYRLRAHGDPLGGGPIRNTDHSSACSIPGCENEYLAKGLCAMHYARRRLHGDPLYQPEPAEAMPCTVRGCSSLQIGRGLCGKHYQRYLKHGDPEKSLRSEIGKGGISSTGYRVLYRPGHPNASVTGRIQEHRYVMAQVLGRPLRRDETVHHRNGNRLDNRPENLELWSSAHSHGQRVEELVAWAREILERYEQHLDKIVRHGPDCGGD